MENVFSINQTLCSYLSPENVIAHAWSCGLLHSLHSVCLRHLSAVNNHSLIVDWLIHCCKDHVRCGVYCTRCTPDATLIANQSSLVMSAWHNAGVSALSTSVPYFRQYLEFVLRRCEKDSSAWKVILALAPVWYGLSSTYKIKIEMSNLAGGKETAVFYAH